MGGLGLVCIMRTDVCDEDVLDVVGVWFGGSLRGFVMVADFVLTNGYLL